MKKIMNAYDVERLRDKLAKQSKLEQLKDAYSSKYPEIKNKNTPQLWDNFNLERNHFTNSDDPQANDKLNLISKNLTGKNIKVLNVGFGSGNLERLVYRNKNIFSWDGVDISKKSVLHAKKIFPKYNFKLGRTDSLKYKDETFDYLLILEVLEHVSPYKIIASLKEANRVLKVGGTLIISVPLNEDLEQMIKNNLNLYQHVRQYTKELIKAELKISGFEPFKEVELISFRRHYAIKKFLVKYILKGYRQSNGITVYARKIS